MLLQMFMYLEEGYTMTEIMEGNASLRSAKILCPELGIAITDLEELIDSGLYISECENLTKEVFAIAIHAYGILLTSCITQKLTIFTELSESIDELYLNLVDGMTMNEATDADPFLSVVLKISTDLNDTLADVYGEILEGYDIADIFDEYNDVFANILSDSAGDLVEFEVRKYLLETSYFESLDLYVEYLDEGYSFEDALLMAEDLDYASKQSEELVEVITEMENYVLEGYSVDEAYELCEDSFYLAIVEAAELIET